MAATIGLAGLGMDETRERLFAACSPPVRRPFVPCNVHEIAARGAFGELGVTLRAPLEGDPKSSMLTVMSLARATDNHARALVL